MTLGTRLSVERVKTTTPNVGLNNRQYKFRAKQSINPVTGEMLHILVKVFDATKS